MADLLKRLKISEQQYGVGMEDNPFQDVSNDEAMKVCFGGGGGGQPPPPPPQTVTQQTSNIPEYFQPYLERLFDRAEAVTTEPFQRYEGQRLATTTPQQQAAYQGVEEMVGGYKPYIATADLLTAQAAQQSTDPTAIASRMSPYQQAVVDIQKREALRDANKLQQQIGASAVGAGAFGGSRQALAETELARQTGQRLADIQAVGSQQAFQQAMNQLSADRAASLAAGQQFAGLGAQQQQLGLAGLGALETVGGTQQAQQQKALDIAYEDFARETTYPQQQLQEMSSVLRGFNLPVSTYTTSQAQQAPPTFGQQAAGLGLGALGIYGAGKGVGLFAEGGDVPDNPGLKKLASKAPQVVEKMGFDPQEVINAYMGGKINFQKGMSVYGTAAGAGATATPEEEEEVIERQKEIERDTALGRFFGGPRSQKKYDDMMKELPFEVMTMPGSYLRPGVETFTDDEGNFIMPKQKARPRIKSKKDKAKAKELKKQEETDVQDKIKTAEEEKQRLLAEQEEQRKAALLAAQQKDQQPEVGGNMYNALMENILGLVGREKTDLEKYTDALRAGAAGLRGFDVAMGKVGREDAQKIIDTGISDLSSISAEDRKRLKEDTSLLTTGATLELEKGKIGADVRNNLTKMAMEQLKLNSAEAREIAKQVITANPFLIQDYTRETDPIKKAMLADQLTAAMEVTKSSLDQIKSGIVAGATDSFDQSKFINTKLGQVSARQATSPSRTK